MDQVFYIASHHPCNIDYEVSGLGSKCGFQLNTLWWHSKLLNIKTKLLIFHSFIKANLNYCLLILINRNRTDMKCIENVQTRALQIVFNDIIADYSDLLKKANTCTIETRWKRQLVTEVYKAVNSLTPSYISDMFKKNPVNYNLRRSKLITQPKFLSQTLGYHSLRQEGTRLWDTLTNIRKDAKDVNAFKRMTVKYVKWF